MTDPKKIKAVLLDFGNVVAHIDFHETFRTWGRLAHRPDDHFRSRFSMDEAYHRHERGEIGPEEYFGHLSQVFELNLDFDQWAEGWNAMFLEPVPGLEPLLPRLKKRTPLAMFSNTNDLHKRFWKAKYKPLLSHFDRIFTSDELGLRKPEAPAFAAVARELGVLAEEILFLDDTLENVEGALRAGYQAVHVPTLASVIDALNAYEKAVQP